MAAKILIVDDGPILVRGLKFSLESEGYEVVCAYDGKEAVEAARQEKPDLILLDLTMPSGEEPNGGGMEACISIRAFSSVPIIMLSSSGNDAHKLMCFSCGADDYVQKPFNILELKARIRVFLRRSGAPTAPPLDTHLVVCGPLVLDTVRRTVESNGNPIGLTAREFELVSLLMQHPGKVFTRETLLDAVWGFEYKGDFRTVDVHIRRIREKLEDDPAHPNMLMTKWGVGYFIKECS